MKTLTVTVEREGRRLAILVGISKNLSYSEIADQLGVKRWIINSDIRKMKFNRDLELGMAFKERDILLQASMQNYSTNLETRFHRMTGMSLEEKTFKNMINFYRYELDKVVNSKNETRELSKLSSTIRKTLRKNEIITQGWGRYEITSKARSFLTSKQTQKE